MDHCVKTQYWVLVVNCKLYSRWVLYSTELYDDRKMPCCEWCEWQKRHIHRDLFFKYSLKMLTVVKFIAFALLLKALVLYLHSLIWSNFYSHTCHSCWWAIRSKKAVTWRCLTSAKHIWDIRTEGNLMQLYDLSVVKAIEKWSMLSNLLVFLKTWVFGHQQIN